MQESQITGCILGTAVGDALGLPYEGVSRQRSRRLLGPPDRHRFLLRRGMVSDDTEHTCLVAQALIASNFNLQRFTNDLGRRLRWWFVSVPAGIGRATLRSCLKLWMGVSPTASGVYSAGNGPAMRSAILGVVFDDVGSMVEYVRVSARMTHTDPRAEYGAVAIALATHVGIRHAVIDGPAFVEALESIIGDDGHELLILLRSVVDSVHSGQSTLDFAANNGLEKGVSGYTYHTVPVVIHAWLSHPRNYGAAVASVIQCGGDADTTAAIVGGIVGAAVGESGIPEDWVSHICEWPRSVNWMKRLSVQLYQAKNGSVCAKPVGLNFPAVVLRNMVFVIIVLIHGFRRLLPPY